MTALAAAPLPFYDHERLLVRRYAANRNRHVFYPIPIRSRIEAADAEPAYVVGADEMRCGKCGPSMLTDQFHRLKHQDDRA